VVPDIITLSKALTGGTLPLAATIASAELFGDFLSDDPGHALMHGPTFMANAMGCAAANASLDLFETEPRLEQAVRIEKQLSTELDSCRALRNVVDVRVKGAIGVVQLSSIANPAALRSRLIECGVWIRPFGNVVYLTTALTIGEDELTQLTDAIRSVLRAQ
jgi:adenosylmethionine-8-amino-7-oxononanoate aminotransferase